MGATREQPPNQGDVSGSEAQRVPTTSGEFVCHYADCRRRFVRKTSLTNHLKAHQNVKSRSIYRTKRARQRAAAAAAELREATARLAHASHPSFNPPQPVCTSAISNPNNPSSFIGSSQETNPSVSYPAFTAQRPDIDVALASVSMCTSLSPFSAMSTPTSVGGVTAVSSAQEPTAEVHGQFDLGLELELASPWAREKPIGDEVHESGDPHSVESFTPAGGYDSSATSIVPPVEIMTHSAPFPQVSAGINPPVLQQRIESSVANGSYDILRDQLTLLGQFGPYSDM